MMPPVNLTKIFTNSARKPLFNVPFRTNVPVSVPFRPLICPAANVIVPVCRPSVAVSTVAHPAVFSTIQSNVVDMSSCVSSLSSSSFEVNNNKQPSSKPRSRFTFDEQVSLCKEVMMTNLFSFPKGSPKRTPIWEELTSKMSVITGRPLKRRFIREHFNELFSEFKIKQNLQIKGSGMNDPTPTELDELLQNLRDIENDGKLEKEASQAKEEKAKLKRKTLCETIGETKTREEAPKKPRQERSDKKVENRETVLNFVRDKSERELDLREKELAIKERELALKEELYRQNTFLIKSMQQTIDDQKEIIDKLLNNREA
ncbi:uncharacterized protein [Clytia hemisphaerica]|uniref:uncharacterized protein n=1 Tax=Clytia hemisphaerica TaxID=252671 RepID=UPI0034D73480